MGEGGMSASRSALPTGGSASGGVASMGSTFRWGLPPGGPASTGVCIGGLHWGVCIGGCLPPGGGVCLQGVLPPGVCLHGVLHPRGSASTGVCIHGGLHWGVCLQDRVGQTPPALRDMVNKRAVRIPLECILVQHASETGFLSSDGLGLTNTK